MNQAVNDFAGQVKLSGEIIEVGSFDCNGSVRDVIPVTVGIDIRKGKNVDRVMDACDLLKVFGRESFDHGICVETLEHCEDWKEVIRQLFAVVKKDGIIVLTTPPARKKRHNYPDDFWRFTLDDLLEIFGDNTILYKRENLPGVGVIIKKTGMLGNLDSIEPSVVNG